MIKQSKNFFQAKRCLVLGGAGFIGSNLTIELVRLGADVTVLDNFNPRYGANEFNLRPIAGHMRLIREDLNTAGNNPDFLKSLDEAEYIFNLVAQTGHLESTDQPMRDVEINISAQISFLEALKKRKLRPRVTYVSTRQVYGKALTNPVAEDHLIAPRDINGINKFTAEQYHLHYARLYGFRCKVLRLTNTFGPRMRVKDSTQNFLGRWFKCAVEESEIEVWGENTLRNYSYVDDVVSNLISLWQEESTHEIYNMLGEDVVTLGELAQELAALCPGLTIAYRSLPDANKPIDIGNFILSGERLRAEIRDSHYTPLRESIAKTLEYYRAHLGNYT